MSSNDTSNVKLGICHKTRYVILMNTRETAQYMHVEYLILSHMILQPLADGEILAQVCIVVGAGQKPEATRFAVGIRYIAGVTL